MSQSLGHRIGLGLGVIIAAAALTPSDAWAQKAGGAAAKPTAAAGAAAAAPDLNAAKKHYTEGEKKLKAEDFEGALAEFKAANEIKGTPHAELKIGVCEDNLGHYRSADEWYKKFLEHVPEKLTSQGEDIKKRVAAIEAMPGKVHVESDPAGATVAVDGKAQTGATPLDVEVPAGSHELKLTEAGRLPATKTVDVGSASTQTVTAELAAEPPAAAPPPPPVAVAPPPPPPPPAPAPEPRSLVPAYITGALAIAAAGVGTGFGIAALNDKSSFDKNPTTQTADNGDTHSLIADMAFGVAITFGVTSAVLFLTKDEAPATAAAPKRPVEAGGDRVSVTPAPMVGPHLAGAGLTMKF